MSHYVGLDVSQKETHICIVTHEGKSVWQGKCLTSPTAITAKIRKHAPEVRKVGLETGALAPWLWHEMNALGLPVVCMDARQANAILSVTLNKTDRNDAQALARLLQTDMYRDVKVKSFDSHRVRAFLGVRAQLVAIESDLKNQVRGLLKVEGTVLTRSQINDLGPNVPKNGPHAHAILALGEVLDKVREKVRELDKELDAIAREDKDIQRLMTIPGIGPVTAVAFCSMLDDPARFRHSRDVGAYLGLTPRRYQSGAKDVTGRISKCGDGLVRSYLCQAAVVILNRLKTSSPLLEWAQRVKGRTGAKKAMVALARKLAVIMHRMLVTGDEFNAARAAAELQAA